MKDNGNKDKNLDQLSDDAKKYSEAWTDMMRKIWYARVASKQAMDTGELRSSTIRHNIKPIFNNASIEFAFRFITYGIYVDSGVGNGYSRKNGGYLKILDPIYRKEHGLDKKRKAGHDSKETSGKPRKKKEWFSPSWFISQRVLTDKMADFLGDKFVAIFDNLTEE